MEYFKHVSSPIGTLTVRCSETAVTGLWLLGQKHYPDLSSAIQSYNHPMIIQTEQWVQDYFQGNRPDPLALPVLFQGTPFQITVWNALRNIPYGSTRSYGQLAEKIGRPGAFQAVGGAVGRNPISIIVPCHRVIGQSGSLTGFAGGIPAKAFLLSLEQRTK